MRWFKITTLAAAATISAAGLSYAQGASVWGGVYSAAQAERGKALALANCSRCHGSNGEGNDEIPPLKGPHFMSNWEGQTVADLVERVHGTMPLDNPGALSLTSATDVAAYLLQANGMPAGKAELSSEPPVQSQIRIQAANPNGPSANALPARKARGARQIVLARAR